MDDFCIITFNIRGLKGRYHDLTNFLQARRPHVVLLQETLLSSHQRAAIHGYTLLRKDRLPPAQGTAIYLRSDVIAREFTLPDVVFEAQAILVKIGAGELLLINAYTTPQGQLPIADLQRVLSLRAPTLLIGDLNARHTAWLCPASTQRGRALLRMIQQDNLSLHHPDEPTFYPTTSHYRPSVLDVAISRDLPFAVHTSVHHQLDSDHLPVEYLLSSALPHPAPAPRRRNYAKADWNRYNQILHDSTIPQRFSSREDIDRGVSYLTATIQQAAAQAIPTLHPRVGMKLPPELAALATRRNQARRRWQRSRLAADRAEYHRLIATFRLRMKEFVSRNWSEAINCPEDHHAKLWRITRTLRRTRPSLPALITPTGEVYSPAEKAAALADASTVDLAPSTDPALEEEATSLLEELRSIPDDQPTAIKLATPKEITAAISSLRPRKAPGPDGITAPLLRHIPRRTLVYLTMLINACLLIGYFPEAWKTATTIFLPKPGKDHRDPANYRPISLLNILGKVFEKIIARRLDEVTSRLKVIPPFQHGFSPGLGTLTQLHRVVDIVVGHLNNRRSVAMVSLDLSRAFDSVWHEGLLLKMQLAGYPRGLLRLLASYFQDRTFRPRAGCFLGDPRPISCGVPQGSILGPKLFVIYTADIPRVPNVDVATYADDTALLAASIRCERSIALAQSALDAIVTYYARWRLTNNAAKTQALLFGRSRLRPPARLVSSGTVIPWSPTLKYLGITIDPRLTFNRHIQNKLQHAQVVRGMLLPLIRCRGPLDPRLKLRLYKTILRPLLSYGAPIWLPYISATNWLLLQRKQNVAVKHAIGLTKLDSSTQAHTATGTPSLYEHCLRLYRGHNTRIAEHRQRTLRQLTRGAFPEGPRLLPRPSFLYHLNK